MPEAVGRHGYEVLSIGLPKRAGDRLLQTTGTFGPTRTVLPRQHVTSGSVSFP